jgi:hypothetical protein
MAMITTTTAALDALFVPVISALVPLTTYKGAEKWKHYDAATSAPTTTRRFTLVWGELRPFERGAFTPDACEYDCEFAVRTDYAGRHALQQHAIGEDTHHVALALARLRGEATGVFHVRAIRRTQQSRSATDTPDVVQIDHVYTVRFMRALNV